MHGHSREMLLTKVKEAVDAYISVLLADEELSDEERLEELNTARQWLREQWSAVENRRSEVEGRTHAVSATASGA